MLMFNVTVNAEADEEKETFVKESNTQTVEQTKIETQKVEDSSPEDTKPSLPLSVSPPPEPEIASVSEQAANELCESVSTVLLECTDQKPEIEGVFANRKLFVIRAADIQRSRSADIFGPDNVAATSGPATARAQSETRDVTDCWYALSKTEQTSAVENLTSPVYNIHRCVFNIAAFLNIGKGKGKGKGKGTRICIEPVRTLLQKRSGMNHTAFTLLTHHICLYLVSVHQAAPPLSSSIYQPRVDERLS